MAPNIVASVELDDHAQRLSATPPGNRAGEISPDTDLDLAQDLFGGLLYWRGIILGEHFPPNYAQRLTQATLRSLDSTAPLKR